MAQHSVTQSQPSGLASQVQRRWQQEFRQRMRAVPLEQWRCVGIDVGKYEHVAVITDGWGNLLAPPLRFGIRRADYQQFFDWVDRLATDSPVSPLQGMEPTGHYYEQLAYETSQRYGPAQVYLIQSTDVAHHRQDWNQSTFKTDEVDACIIAELLRAGHGRPYRPNEGAYLSLYHLERCRLNREQASTRLKNYIVGHVDRLFPGLVVKDCQLAKQYPPLFKNLWSQDTPRRLLTLCPDPRQLRAHTAESLYELFRAAGYWMTRPYAAKILAAVQALCLPEQAMAQARLRYLQRDLISLAQVEQQLVEVEAEMAELLDLTWGRFLRPTGVAPIRLACLVATIGDIQQYTSARQLFGRSGLYSRCTDSGTHQRRGQGQRIVKPGDRHLRRQLLRFTWCMLARYPTLRRYKAQLCQRGKSKITATIAVARKLTGIIYAVATQEVPFDPSHIA